MKTQEEIEKLAEKHYTQITLSQRTAFKLGYTQCQKDMADKKYNLDNFKKSIKITNNKLKYIEDYINLLNKQD